MLRKGSSSLALLQHSLVELLLLFLLRNFMQLLQQSRR